MNIKTKFDIGQRASAILHVKLPIVEGKIGKIEIGKDGVWYYFEQRCSPFRDFDIFPTRSAALKALKARKG